MEQRSIGSTTSVVDVVAVLAAVDVHRLTDGDAREALAALARVANWTAATRAALIRRLDALAGAAPPGCGMAPGVPGDGGEGEGEGEGDGDGAAEPAGRGGGANSKPAELELADVSKLTEREAARVTALARLLGRFPEFAAALHESLVAESHLQVLGRLWQQLELADRHRLMELDAQLVQLARHHDPERFRRLVASELNRRRERDGDDRLAKQRRSTGLNHWVDDSGMVVVRARFDPERGHRLVHRIRARRQAIIDAGLEPADCPTDGDLRREHLDAIALFELTDDGRAAEGDASASPGHGQRRRMFGPPDTELVVLIDERSLREGVHPDTRVDAHGADLPVSAVRRLACDAGIIPVVLGGDGVVLDVGRVRRLATHAQRVALRVMYASCAVPGCGVPFDYCTVHHLDPWQPADPAGRGGATDLANLLPLCSRHHHAAHEGGWQFELDTGTRVLRVTRPDGAVLLGRPDTAGETDGSRAGEVPLHARPERPPAA